MDNQMDLMAGTVKKFNKHFLEFVRLLSLGDPDREAAILKIRPALKADNLEEPFFYRQIENLFFQIRQYQEFKNAVKTFDQSYQAPVDTPLNKNQRDTVYRHAARLPGPCHAFFLYWLFTKRPEFFTSEKGSW